MMVPRTRLPTIVTRSSARLRLIRNDRNHGKGYTVRQGVLAASGKYVLFTDADLSAPIEEVNKLLDIADNGRRRRGDRLARRGPEVH